jgi:hypothetical protein
MNRWWLLLAWGLLVGCEGETARLLPYEDEAERAARALCTHAERCQGQADSYDACFQRATEALAGVRPELEGGAGGAMAGCIQCLRALASTHEAATDSQCQAAPDDARIRGACGSERQACAGAP